MEGRTNKTKTAQGRLLEFQGSKGEEETGPNPEESSATAEFIGKILELVTRESEAYEDC